MALDLSLNAKQPHSTTNLNRQTIGRHHCAPSHGKKLMTRMTETAGGEINFYRPRIGTKVGDVYDRLREGEEVTAKDAERVFEFGLELVCSRPYRPGKSGALYRMVGEWHDFVYYPIEKAHMIDASEHDFELDFMSYQNDEL